MRSEKLISRTALPVVDQSADSSGNCVSFSALLCGSKCFPDGVWGGATAESALPTGSRWGRALPGGGLSIVPSLPKPRWIRGDSFVPQSILRGSECFPGRGTSGSRQCRPAIRNADSKTSGPLIHGPRQSSPEPAAASGAGHCPVRKAASPTSPCPVSPRRRNRNPRG